MDNPNIGDRVVADVAKDFKVIGTRHVHGAWLWWLLGLTVAFAGTIIYISNNQGRFTLSSADGGKCPAPPPPTTFHGYGEKEIMSPILYGKYLALKNYGIRPEGYNDEQVSDLLAYGKAQTEKAAAAATEACEADYTKNYIENAKACEAFAATCSANTEPKCDFVIDLPPSKACPAATCDELGDRCSSRSPDVGVGCACIGQIAVPVTTTGQLPVMPGGQYDNEPFPSAVTPAKEQQAPTLVPPPADEVKESL